jgi:hypothetical protein
MLHIQFPCSCGAYTCAPLAGGLSSCADDCRFFQFPDDSFISPACHFCRIPLHSVVFIPRMFCYLCVAFVFGGDSGVKRPSCPPVAVGCCIYRLCLLDGVVPEYAPQRSSYLNAVRVRCFSFCGLLSIPTQDGSLSLLKEAAERRGRADLPVW